MLRDTSVACGKDHVARCHDLRLHAIHRHHPQLADGVEAALLQHPTEETVPGSLALCMEFVYIYYIIIIYIYILC